MIMQFKRKLFTNNKSKGTNTKEYIVLHHTATQEGSIEGVLKTLTVGPVSVHYVVDTNGDIYKIWEDHDILWHAGVSTWEGKTDLNRFSIGIETIWPLKSGGFTDEQRKAVKELIKYLSGLYKIPKEKLIRHKDISPKRKIDILDTFWLPVASTWIAYKDSIFQNEAESAVNKFADKYWIRKRGNNEQFSCFEILSILARMDK